MVPLQLERRGQSVHAFIQQLHHAIVAAKDVDFANPDRARRFNLDRSVGRSNPGAAHPSKTFPHPLKKPRSIVVPLIAIVFANEIGHNVPVSVVDRVKEMFCIQPDLMLGTPKPEQIYADAQRNGQRADDCSTKRNRHMRCNDTTSGSNLPLWPVFLGAVAAPVRPPGCVAAGETRETSSSAADRAHHQRAQKAHGAWHCRTGNSRPARRLYCLRSNRLIRPSRRRHRCRNFKPRRNRLRACSAASPQTRRRQVVLI